MPDQGSKYIKFIKKQILSKYVFKKEIQLGNLLLFHLHNHENARIFFFVETDLRFCLITVV